MCPFDRILFYCRCRLTAQNAIDKDYVGLCVLLTVSFYCRCRLTAQNAIDKDYVGLCVLSIFQQALIFWPSTKFKLYNAFQSKCCKIVEKEIEFWQNVYCDSHSSLGGVYLCLLSLFLLRYGCDLVQRVSLYRSADKSLARSGRKQANVSVRMACITFGALHVLSILQGCW